MEINACPVCSAECYHYEYGEITNRYGGYFPPLHVIACKECSYRHGHKHGKERTIEEHNAKRPENKNIGIIVL
jgi:C4-type Zn-finger protein